MARLSRLPSQWTPYSRPSIPVPRVVGSISNQGRARVPFPHPAEVEVPRVDHEASCRSNDKDRVDAITGIGEQQDAAEKAEIPKGLRDDAHSRSLSCDPLYDEAHRKH